MAHRWPLVIATALIATACDGRSAGWQALGLDSAPAYAGEVDYPNTAGSFLVGQFALERGALDVAAAEYAQALRADPANVELKRQVFQLHVASGQFDAAETDARELVELSPDADEARLVLGIELVRDGSFDAALVQFEQIPTHSLIGAVRPVLIAWTRFGAGDTDGAVEALVSSNASDGFETMRRYHRARILAASGRSAEARTELDDLLKDAGQIPVGMLVMALALDVELEDEASALARLDAYLAENPDDLGADSLRPFVEDGEIAEMVGATPAAGMADTLRLLAAALYEQRVASQALFYNRLAERLAPDASETHLLTAQILIDSGNPTEGLDELERAEVAPPYELQAGLLEAQALEALEDPDAAAAALRKVSADRPEQTQTLIALGDMLRSEELFAEAESAYSEAIDRRNRTGEAGWQLYYSRGIARERQGRWDDAEADFQHALALEPEEPFILNYLGYSWVDRGENLDEAKGMLERAVELRPDSGYIVDSLGWALFRIEDYDGAVEQLERAVELVPGDPVVNDHLGDAYWKVGRFREARFQWQRTLTLDPEAEEVAKIEAKIANGLGAEADADSG